MAEAGQILNRDIAISDGSAFSVFEYPFNPYPVEGGIIRG